MAGGGDDLAKVLFSSSEADVEQQARHDGGGGRDGRGSRLGGGGENHLSYMIIACPPEATDPVKGGCAERWLTKSGMVIVLSYFSAGLEIRVLFSAGLSTCGVEISFAP